MTIRGDGNCVLRLAGEINALLRDSNHFASGYAPCLETDLAQARAETVSNFTKWLSEKKEFFPEQNEFEDFVIAYVEDTVQEFYDRVEGKCTGRGMLASNIDFGVFTRDKDVQLIILRTLEVITGDLKNAFTLCDFRNQSEKKRVAIVILHRGHVDLFILRRGDKIQVLFDIGKEADFARSAALDFMQHLKAQKVLSLPVSPSRAATPSSSWPKWRATFAEYEAARATSRFPHDYAPAQNASPAPPPTSRAVDLTDSPDQVRCTPTRTLSFCGSPAALNLLNRTPEARSHLSDTNALLSTTSTAPAAPTASLSTATAPSSPGTATATTIAASTTTTTQLIASSPTHTSSSSLTTSTALLPLPSEPHSPVISGWRKKHNCPEYFVSIGGQSPTWVPLKHAPSSWSHKISEYDAAHPIAPVIKSRKAKKNTKQPKSTSITASPLAPPSSPVATESPKASSSSICSSDACSSSANLANTEIKSECDNGSNSNVTSAKISDDGVSMPTTSPNDSVLSGISSGSSICTSTSVACDAKVISSAKTGSSIASISGTKESSSIIDMTAPHDGLQSADSTAVSPTSPLKPPPRYKSAHNSQYPFKELIAPEEKLSMIYEFRRKHMKPEYCVCVDNNIVWVSVQSLLPSYDSELRSFNLKRNIHLKEQPKPKTRSADAVQAKGELPPFVPLSSPTFKWGPRDGADFINDVDRAFELTTKWRKNVFKLPSGHSGKDFTKAITRLYEGYGSRSPLECVAFKAAAIMSPLLLQQPAGKPTYRDNVNHLTRRLKLWDEGNIDDLIAEGETIQAQLLKSRKVIDDSTLAKRFATMVCNGNFKGAMSLVTEKGKGGVLPLNDSTKNEMSSKHPKPEPMQDQALLTGVMPPSLHAVFYAPIDGELIKKNAMRTSGGAGVSQQEDALWHKMVSAHKDSSAALCTALASVARRLVTEYVDPKGLEALLANRGIAIDKCPGLRPVGVGEMARRIIGKAVMEVTGPKVQEAVGALQLCAGHPVGVESAIHAMRGFLDDDSSDGILLIDADNAFNRANRAVALWNVQFTCPAMKHVLINFYRSPTRIFMNGDGFFELWSQEGTTQGCPLAMAMYAIALAPLLQRLLPLCKQVWYADDATGCDKFETMRTWFDALVEFGPMYGYYPKPSKCILLTKPDRVDLAQKVFKGSDIDIQTEGAKDSGVEIISNGTRHLGAAVGTEDFKHIYVKKKVDSWIHVVKMLSTIAATEPHAVFAAYTHCLQSQWTFLCRSMPGTPALFEPLEDAIRQVLIPALLRRDVSDLERDLISLPARMGGLGICKPTEQCIISHTNSLYVSEPLVRLVQCQVLEFEPAALSDEIKTLRYDVDKENDTRFKAKLEVILENASEELKRALQAASEKGASSWVTAIPSFDHGTVLHKGEFTDAVYIRYGWNLLNLPLKCACGVSLDIQHALDCKLGGLRTIQHNEVRDVFAQCLREAGHSLVEVEPQLQELSGEKFEYQSANKAADARSDVKCCGFWSNKRQAFFDVKVVSPFARSYAHMTPAQLFKMAESSKIREYGERIREVEHGDFNPLVFTCTGGMAPQCQLVMKRLAEQMSKKQNIPQSVVSGWLRCRLSFALLRTTLLCVRATRRKRFVIDNNIELAMSESRIEH